MSEEKASIHYCSFMQYRTGPKAECEYYRAGQCSHPWNDNDDTCDFEGVDYFEAADLAALRAKNAELEVRVKELETKRMEFIKACERIIATGKNLLIRDHAYFNTWWHREFEDAINDFLTAPPAEPDKR